MINHIKSFFIDKSIRSPSLMLYLHALISSPHAVFNMKQVEYQSSYWD